MNSTAKAKGSIGSFNPTQGTRGSDVDRSISHALHITLVNPRKLSRGGGSEHWVSEVSKYLSARGHHVEVLVPEDLDIPNIGSSSWREVRIRSRVYNLLKRIGALNLFPPLYLARIEKGTDIVYSTSMMPLIFLALTGKPVIIGTQDYFFNNTPSWRDKLLHLAMAFVKRVSSRRFAIHLLSDYHSARIGVAKRTIFEIPNFNDTTELRASSYRTQTFNVLFFGRVEDRKGARLLFEVADSLVGISGVCLNVMGEVSKEYRNYVKRFRNVENVKFLGYLDGIEKQNVLQSSSCLLFLSKRDSMPFVIIQSMGYGLPIISTWEYASKVFPSDGIYSCIENVQEVLSCVLKLYELWKSDPSGYDVLSLRLKELSDHHYNRNSVMSDIEQMFISASASDVHE